MGFHVPPFEPWNNQAQQCYQQWDRGMWITLQGVRGDRAEPLVGINTPHKIGKLSSQSEEIKNIP